MNFQDANQTVDLSILVTTELKQTSHYLVGPCPFCNGVDRFTLKHTNDGWLWHCRQCSPGKYKTVIDFVMKKEGCDAKEALAHLGGTTTAPVKTSRPAPVRPVARPVELPSDEWQENAWHLVDQASDRLFHDRVYQGGKWQDADGQPVRDYLTSRGLTLATARAWNLGAAWHYDPKLKARRSALVLPWWDVPYVNYQVTAVKIRFVDHQPEGLRYTSLYKSVPLIYGLNGLTGSRENLLLIEGEINALSVWQAAAEAGTLYGLNVLSFGSEGGGRPELMQAIAKRYRSTFLWLDDPEQARKYQAVLSVPTANLIQSPKQNDHKVDANDMLTAGVLGEFLAARVGKVARVPA